MNLAHRQPLKGKLMPLTATLDQDDIVIIRPSGKLPPVDDDGAPKITAKPKVGILKINNENEIVIAEMQ